MMPTTPRSTYLKQAGFSMVELMVALVLGLFVTTAVLQTFVGAKQAYEFQQEFSRIQENGRFAMGFLSRDIRGADYWGCLNDGTKVTSILNGAGGPDDFAVGLQGFDNVPAVSTGYNSLFGGVFQADAQPDAIVLQGGQSVGISVEKVPSKISPNIHLQTTVGQISKGDILLVSDCTDAVIFQVSDDVNPSDKVLFHKADTSPNPDPYPGNSQNGFDLVFKNDASVFKAGSIRYWIRTGAGGEPALVRGDPSIHDWTGGDELVEGVENMQILYGVDTSGNKTPNYFVPANQVSDAAASISMKDVVSVQIHLVVRSLRDNMVDDRKQIQYYAGPNTPPDNRIRKMFTFTVAIRNRLD